LTDSAINERRCSSPILGIGRQRKNSRKQRPWFVANQNLTNKFTESVGNGSLVPAVLGRAQTAVLHTELLMLSCLNDVEADFDEKKMGEHRPLGR
jgi:hypothetical protein